MIKQTDLEKVKEVAKMFLYFKIEQSSKYEELVFHPFISSSTEMIWDSKTNTRIAVDVLTDLEALEVYREMMKQRIDEATRLWDIHIMINKCYKMFFLKEIASHLSTTDIGVYLRDNFSMVENVSDDVDISKFQIMMLFKKSDLNTRMHEEDRVIFDALPNDVTIYRGVRGFNPDHAQSLSWTLDIEQARKFANRYSTGGCVYAAIIQKGNILAYYGGRSEAEVIVDYKKLRDIKQLEIID